MGLCMYLEGLNRSLGQQATLCKCFYMPWHVCPAGMAHYRLNSKIHISSVLSTCSSDDSNFGLWLLMH